MSTKVYEAYRFHRSKLEAFIRMFNIICVEKVIEAATSAVLTDKALRETRKRLFGKRWLSKRINYEYTGSDISLVWALATAMQMSKTCRNDAFNFDCSFNVWVKGSCCYVIPYIANHIKLSKELPKWCKDYSYWDNSDQPEGISNREWKNREILWGEFTDNWDKSRLTHVTFELKTPYQTGLQTLLKTMSDDEKWRDRIYVASCSLFSQMEEEREAKMDKRTLTAP